MNKTFKIIIYIFAAMMLTATPSLSALAVDESIQTTETPTESSPAESQPTPSIVPDQTPDDSVSTPENVPEQSEPSQESSAPQSPTDTTESTLPSAPAAQPLPESTPTTSQNNSTVTPMQGTVYAATENGLNVRSGPSTNHSKIGTLKYGQAITITGKTADNWYQIQYSSGVGYVLADYVSSKPLTDTEEENKNLATDTPVTDSPDLELTGNETSNVTTTESFIEEVDSESQTENNREITSSLLGTPIVVGLVIAILIVLALIGYSVYSLFKKENNTDDAYYEDEYYEDESFPEDEYYENESFSEDEYYENESFSEDEYYENEPLSEDEYYEEEEYPDDKPRHR